MPGYDPQDDKDDANKLQAKLAALKSLQAAGFYDQKMDNPQNLPLDTTAVRTPQQAALSNNVPASPMPSPSPMPAVPPAQQTMQGNAMPLINAMKRVNGEEQLDGLFPSK